MVCSKDTATLELGKQDLIYSSGFDSRLLSQYVIYTLESWSNTILSNAR